MMNYSIVRIGNEYIVQANEKSVLKTSSRRKAARLVHDAAELLDSKSPSQSLAGASTACDAEVTPVASEVP